MEEKKQGQEEKEKGTSQTKARQLWDLIRCRASFQIRCLLFFKETLTML